ncbi:hypothetical protein TB2_021791 [Malus domestica]
MDDRLEHGIDPPLEVEGGVEAWILAHLQPQLADQHRCTPSVLQGEPTQDVDQALLGQLGPVRAGLCHSFFGVGCVHFQWLHETGKWLKTGSRTSSSTI